MKRNLIRKQSLIISIALCLFQSAYAAPLFEDGFAYPAGNLAGNGAWAGANVNIQVGAPSLTYSGLADTAVPGSAVTVTSGGTSGTTTKVNFTSTPITSGSIYYSFLAQCTTLPTGNSYLTSLNASGGGPSGSGDPLAVYVGQQVAGSQFKIGVRDGGTGAKYATSSALTLGTVNFFVVEYSFGSPSGTVNLFINPTPGGSEPATPDATMVATNIVANLQVVGFKANTTTTAAGVWNFDTVRIADNWADVTPLAVPEPSACALAGLVLAGLTVWRRVRR